MAAGSTSQFEIFFLILWICISLALIALVVLRKLTLPNFIQGDKRMTGVFALLQLIIFVLLLAALATDSWSHLNVPGGSISFGVAREHGSYGVDKTYSCDGYSGSDKSACYTVIAAGAFTLIFGLIAIFTSFILTIIVIASFFGLNQIEPAKPFVDILANIQWICLLAMLMIWSVSGHDELKQINSSNVDRIGDSWILCLVTTICAVAAALFFAGGTGESLKGDMESTGPSTMNTNASTTGPAATPTTQPSAATAV